MVCYPQGCGLLKGKGIRISSGGIARIRKHREDGGILPYSARPRVKSLISRRHSDMIYRESVDSGAVLCYNISIMHRMFILPHHYFVAFPGIQSIKLPSLQRKEVVVMKQK